MFCYQCEQAAGGKGCSKIGVCGKTPDAASLQDLLVELTKGISMFAHRARQYGKKSASVDSYIIKALFTTVTNVNFDPARLEEKLRAGQEVREVAKSLYKEAMKEKGSQPEELYGPATMTLESGLTKLEKQGEEFSIDNAKKKYGEDIAGLRELVVYGLKGTAAYADHAMLLGYEDEEIYAYFHEALDALTKDDLSPEELLGMSLKVGEINLKTMALLDQANTSTYGHPKPTEVRITPVKGKSILVSGHDLKDLEELLKQTEGKGVNVYTHGEMLPCHGYEKLNQYSHLVGNYGGAWQDQHKEFEAFPGSILMTTNCIQKPKDSYKNRIFTSGLVAWPGVTHVSNTDYSKVIDSALKEDGFQSDEPEKKIMVGFGHNAVLGVADKVVSAVKEGQIKHFFLVGGCDGAKPGRNYYTDFAENVPKDSVILTLACGKFRFNKKDFGDIGGIPRLLDIGQCNDAYSAIQIAVALSKAFETDVNSLPLSMILSWYEQKAVCILLTLLHLGIKNIRIGPSLPAFLTPNVINILVENYGLKPIGDAKEDLKEILG